MNGRRCWENCELHERTIYDFLMFVFPFFCGGMVRMSFVMFRIDVLYYFVHEFAENVGRRRGKGVEV